MAKQGKGRKPESNNNVGKGKVTPVQVAFIVDRYLADNNYSKTRSAFRSEASSLISKSSLHEAPKSLMSLGEMLDDYIWLKEQKVMIEQERNGLAQERCRIQSLLQGMQDLMNVYNSAAAVAVAPNCITPPPPPPPPPGSVPTNSGYPAYYRSPVMTSVSMTRSVEVDHTNYTTPITSSRPPRKRKTYKGSQDVPQAPKKYCTPIVNNSFYDKGSNSVGQPNNAFKGHTNNHQSPPLPSLSPSFAQGGSPIQGSSVAKNLFNKPSVSPPSNSSGPKTPPRALSSQSDKSTSPLEDISSTAKSQHDTTPPETTPTNCTIFSSKTIIMSPAKHISIERNQCTFSSPVKLQSKREHVKGRLDFDSSDVPTNLESTSGDGSSPASESDRDGDLFDLDLGNLDAFGTEFSLSELLTEFGIDCGTTDYSCPSTAGASTDTVPELLHDGNNGELGTSQDFVEHSSSVREVFAGDVCVNGTDSITSVKSVRKCIRIVSPTKCPRNSSIHDQENLSARS